MSEKKSIVALAKEPTIQESVTKVFELMGGVSSLVEKGSTVVLKPNAGHVAPPESAVCTNPDVVRAVIREVKKAEPKRIIIAEAAAIGCDTMECFEACGLTQVAKEEDVELIDIKREKDLINIPVRGYHSNISHVKLPRFLLEAEHIINLPILKAHASMVFSCALKNIKGVVQDKVHLDMHRENLTMAMMDVWWAVRADINIVDAIYAAGGFSPHTPVPEYIGCIMGSRDPVAVDRVACHLSGINPDEVSYFKVAAEVGLGAATDEEIEVIGEKVADHAIHMWVPYLGDMSTRWPHLVRERLLQLSGPAGPEHGDPESHWGVRQKHRRGDCGGPQGFYSRGYSQGAADSPRQLHPEVARPRPVYRGLPARRRGAAQHHHRPQRDE